MNVKNLVNRINLYNLMIFNLVIFSLVSILAFGWKTTLPQIIIAVVSACLLDSLIYCYKTKNFELSKSGIITGFFITLVLSEGQAWYVPLFASAIAIIGKHIGDYFAGLIKLKSHIFNPAMVGILLSTLIFNTSDGWIGATNLTVTIVLALFLLYKFRRFALVITFLLTYFIITFLLNLSFSNIFLNSTIYFFVSFMLLEPKTSPTNLKSMIIYGVISGIIIALTSRFLEAYVLTLGLLICNLFVPLINYLTSPGFAQVNP